MPKNLTDQQNARLRSIVKRELCSRIPAQLHLAPLIGITQASLSRFLDGQTGLGAAVALRIAFLLGRTVEDVLGLEKDAGFVDPQEERYPSRLLTARAAYLDGCPIANIRAALATSLRFDGDPGPRWWRKMMEDGHLAEPGSKQDTDWAVSQVQVDWTKSAKRGRPRKRR